MDDISEKSKPQIIRSTAEDNEVTIVHESTFIPEINENNVVSQIDHKNLKDEDQVEFLGTDKQINDIEKSFDKDSIEIQNNDIEIINVNTNGFGNNSSIVHRDEELPDQILENCNKTSSSLRAIAIEYNSDTETEDDTCIDTSKHFDLNKSDSDNSIEVLYQGSKSEYRTKEKESSSSEDSDSDSDIDSDSDSSNSSDSSVIVTSNDSDDSSKINRNNKKNKGRPKVTELKNELDDLPPIEDLKISVSEDSCDPMGEVAWTVEQLVVVRPKVGKPTLNLDTVLFIDKGKRALGKIFDVFGQVADPHYCVRFNSSEHIKENEIKVGMTVYYCPNTPYTSLVFVHELTKMKASDAVGDDEAPDFSDDEEERQYYENLKKKQVNGTINLDENVPQKKRRKSTSTWQSNHPWNRNTMTRNYKGRNTHGKNNDSTLHPATSDSHNSWSCSSFSYQNNSHYPPHFQQMHSANSGLYGHMPYSDNSQVNSTNQNQNNYNKYNFDARYRNSSKSRLPIVNPDPPYGIPFGVHSPLPFCVNRHDPFSSPNTRLPDTNMYWQSQPSHVIPPWSLLSPPPPPPPAKESHDTPP